MSTELTMPLRELAEILIKHYDINEGAYEVSVEFMIATGAVGPSTEQTYPGAIVGVSKIGLIKTNPDSNNAVDAGVVNPEKKKASARKPKSD